MMSSWFIWSLLIVLSALIEVTKQEKNADFLVFTVASNETDGFKRYLRSAKVYNFEDNVKVLGMGQPWKGGDMMSVGGGYKINLLRKALKDFKDAKDKIVLFTDSYDVIFLAPLEDIAKKFKSFDARILFSAEGYAWPDTSLASQYPPVSRGEPYLNSGGFIGYASDIYAVITSSKVADTDDDQLFYTKIYLNPKLREKHQIKLDHKSEIFQNLFGAVAKVELRFKGNEAYLQNTEYNTVPMIAHGNGRSKIILNALANYLANAWSPEEGCLNCWDNTIELSKDQPQTYPPILIALFVDRPTPFLEEFIQKIYQLAYPKSKLHLFIYNGEPYHESIVKKFTEDHGREYKTVKVISPDDQIAVPAARNLAMNYCLLKECSGYFSVDSVAHLDNENTLKLLVEQQRGIVAPLLVRPEQTWSNFWGAVADNGYYARSSDYMDIIENKRRGLWNVPYITNCYLINVTIVNNPDTRPIYEIDDTESDIAFAKTNRDRNIFMYVSNRLNFGHLVNPDTFDIKNTHPDMYEIFTNKVDWERRYIHVNYSENFNPNKTILQPCPDVFWFPIVNKRFCREFIAIMEAFGQWSDGSNHDSRLQGGYENVPTRDIHMNQVNYEQQWLYFLKEYVRPLQERVYIGYYHDDPRLAGGYEAVPTRDIHMDQVGLHEMWLEFLRVYVNPLQTKAFYGYKDYPPRSLMNFVVRYKPDEQPSLRPHHDTSTYTINIALNQVGVDYEGGGCHFLRYNCSVTDTKPGWMLMHPGRLTHYHEGLLVTRGTRYIMISFVDP